ncbi:uncharacterized protein LOC126291728 isoform X3 [Schistocerca gregaria]|uniref:uncharacterized protein LOC126291728 isoform X3 n=1 Tax=Schistocerca gregaria TaxID=7010 RepID=UPI00211EE60B|nr:uncharacterized protein LOC126291728 isoform X3 [Schistocerca gregaria]XP_049841357.1 uncharacterized protein LOC126291728 isoform X3 [Schistocerca gregaria]
MAFCQTYICGCDSLRKILINTVLHPTPGGVKRRYDVNIVRLQQGWKSYKSHPVTFKDVCERTVYLLYRYSLQVVLSPDWQPTSRWSKSLKSELNDLCLTTSSLIVNNLCYRLKQIVNRPWKHPILTAIICPDSMELDDRQVAKYFRDEGETMVWTRLEVLCENSTVTKNILKHNSQHKIAGDSISPALSYVTQALRYLTNKGKFHEKNQNTDVLCAGCPLDIQDAFLALLAREGKIDEMRHYMYENMSLHTVSNMRERIRNWPGRLPASLASQFCPEYRSICLELYLMGLKLELNRRMDSKSVSTIDKQEMNINPILASVFGRLAKLFNTQWLVKRELLLTAFSLQPNKHWFKELLLVARLSGKTCSARGCTVPFSDSWCRDTAAHTLCSKCGRFGTHGKVHNSADMGSLVWFPLPEHVMDNNLTDPPRCHMLDNKSLGIERNVAEQLVSLVSAFRYKELSWVLEWSKLYTLCVDYMNTKDIRREKNTELKFLKMDYPLYRCLREDKKIVAVKRKKSDEQCTDSDNEKVKYRCDQERKKMNISTYCFYKSRIDVIDDILSSNNITPFSPEVCDMFDVEDTATGFARLCKIRRAMVNLYEKNPEDIFSYFKTKIKYLREKYEIDVQDFVVC